MTELILRTFQWGLSPLQPLAQYAKYISMKRRHSGVLTVQSSQRKGPLALRVLGVDPLGSSSDCHKKRGLSAFSKPLVPNIFISPQWKYLQQDRDLKVFTVSMYGLGLGSYGLLMTSS